VASARGAPLAIFMVVAYAQSHRLILLVFAVGILAIAINELVGAYQHRSETRSE
jgi:hypothetical protein